MNVKTTGPGPAHQTFVETIEKLDRDYFDRNVLVSIDILDEVLSLPCFKSMDLIVFTHKPIDRKTVGVMATLSAHKPPGAGLRIFENIYEIHGLLTGQGEEDLYKLSQEKKRALASLVEKGQAAGYRVFTREPYKVTILAKGPEENLDEGLFLGLVQFVHKVRNHTLNLLNDSFDLTARELSELRKRFCLSIDKTVPMICDHVRSHYGVEARHFLNDYENAGWRVPDEPDQPYPDDLIRIVAETSRKTAASFKRRRRGIEVNRGHKNPVYVTDGGKYYLIVPFLSEKVPKYFKYLIAMRSDAPFPSHVVTNVSTFINDYFDNYLEIQKRELLERLQKETILIYKKLYGLARPSSFNYKEHLKYFAETAFETVIETTNAFSATLRLFEPGPNHLRRLVGRNQRGVVLTVGENDSEIIPADSDDSINAWTFRNCDKEARPPYKEVPNLERDPNKRGDYLKFRDHSRSELCFPLYFKETKVGVLNFESPLRNGFAGDREFLASVKNLIENYFTLLLEFNDKRWLARRSRIYQNMHEMRKIIENDDLNTRYNNVLRDFLSVYMIDQKISHGPIEKVRLGEVRAYREKYIEGYRSEFGPLSLPGEKILEVEQLEKNCQVMIREDGPKVDRHEMDMILIIYKNLLDNFREFSDLRFDTLWVSYHGGASGVLKFRMTSQTLFHYDPLHNILISPILRADPRKPVHYGLFIVGMLARHLSGFAYVHNNEAAGKSSVHVSIPIRGDEEESS